MYLYTLFRLYKSEEIAGTAFVIPLDVYLNNLYILELLVSLFMRHM